MTLLCWSLTPAALSPAQRGLLAISQTELPQVLLTLRQQAPLQELILVSTCQRLEFYGVCEDPASVESALVNWCQQRLNLPWDALKKNTFYTVYTANRAARHLFEVAAGLQSLSLGESEIMGQLRRAWNTASQKHTSGSVLNGLFAHALTTGRQVRHKTGIARGALSLESLALEKIAHHFQRPLSELRCLVVGTGQMGQAVLRQLSHRQVKNVRAVNRSITQAQKASPFPPEPWHHLREALQWAEAIIVCTAAPHPVITSAHLPPSDSPQVILDLSLPANVEAELGQTRGPANAVTLYPLNVLHQQLARVQQRKRQGLKEVNQCVSQGWENYLHWRKERALAPFLTAVYQRVPKTATSPATPEKALDLRQRLHPLVTALKQAKTQQIRTAYQREILHLIENTG